MSARSPKRSFAARPADPESWIKAPDRHAPRSQASEDFSARLTIDVTADMRIYKEEIFGPVMSILVWSDYDEMFLQVNELDYGLTALIVTNDLHTAMETAERVEAGYVWINANDRYLGAPYGGWKYSGLGQEECFDELFSYTRTKNINMRWKTR